MLPPDLLEPLDEVSAPLLLAALAYAGLAARAFSGRSSACPRPVLLSGRAMGWPLLAVALWCGLEAFVPLLETSFQGELVDLLRTLPAAALLPALVISQQPQRIPAPWTRRASQVALVIFPMALAAAAPLTHGLPLDGGGALALRAAQGVEIAYALGCAGALALLVRRRYDGIARQRRAEWGAALLALSLPVCVAASFAAAQAPAWQGLSLGLVVALPVVAWLFEAEHTGATTLRRLLDALESPALLVDDRCLVVHATPSALALLGMETAPRAAHINSVAPLLGRLLLAGRTSGRLGLRNERAEPIEVEVRVAPLPFGQLGFAGRVVTLREMTRQRELAQRIRRMAFHDELTGIANRRSFVKELGRCLARIAENGGEAALLYLDLDGFKELNDSLGHAAGDEALRAIAHRLRQALRAQAALPGAPATSLARIGGDEFAVLVKSSDGDEQVQAVAESLLQLSREPVWASDQTVRLSFSIGLAFAPRDGTSAKDLFQRADLALYHAKRAGAGRAVTFHASLEAETSRTSSVKHHLRGAIDNDEFRIHYQPKIDLQTRKIVGAEALLRWKHESLGSIGPAEFIPVAESANLIEGIGTWVLEAACQQVRDWRDGGLAVPPIAVNVSSRQIGAEFPNVVSRALRRLELEPRAIEIELTESTLLTHSEEVDRCLSELDAMGIRIALDDFGTGYSALAYLTRMPLSVLKLDRSLVRNIHEDQNAANVSAAVISMAHGLGLRVVAEGVDCEEQVEALRQLGCDEAQGFLFSPAVTPAEFVALLERSGWSGAEAPPHEASAPVRVEAPPARQALPAPGDSLTAAARGQDGDSRFALLIDDDSGVLGPVALDLTRLGVLVLYTAFQDEAHLLVEQEAGNIRALLMAPHVELARVERLADQISRALDGASVTRVVVGAPPDAERRAALRAAGVSWALWSPFQEDALRFVVESALVLPREMASRSEPRVPAGLSVAVSGPEGSMLGRMLSLSAGGAYIHAAQLPALGNRIELHFGVEGEMIETGARVAHVAERQVSWRPSFPRGFGVAFEHLDPEDEERIRAYVKASLTRYTP